MPDAKRSAMIGRSIHRLDIQIRRQLDTSVSHRSLESISGNNGFIIGFLVEHQDREVYQRDLEAAFGITRSTASKVIGLMERKGLVERKSVPHDARLKQLVLTDKAWSLSEAMAQDGKQMEKLLLKGFTDDEKATLTNYLARMRQNLMEEEKK